MNVVKEVKNNNRTNHKIEFFFSIDSKVRFVLMFDKKYDMKAQENIKTE